MESRQTDPYGECADVICGEPDAHEAIIVPPPVADTTGEEIPAVDLSVETLYVPRIGRELRFIHRAASIADEAKRAQVLAGASKMTTAQAHAALRALGWRIRTTGEYAQALRNFQGAWNLGAALKVDGRLGPLTSSALSVSVTQRGKGQPDASPHFAFTELACKCGGRYSTCQRIWVDRALLVSLETIRTKAYPHGIDLASVCRCPGHNQSVGGAATSQHMYGSAADLPYAVTDSIMISWRVAAGVGRSASTRRVRHADRRDQSGHNPTGGTLAHPTCWDYAA